MEVKNERFSKLLIPASVGIGIGAVMGTLFHKVLKKNLAFSSPSALVAGLSASLITAQCAKNSKQADEIPQNPPNEPPPSPVKKHLVRNITLFNFPLKLHKDPPENGKTVSSLSLDTFDAKNKNNYFVYISIYSAQAHLKGWLSLEEAVRFAEHLLPKKKGTIEAATSLSIQENPRAVSLHVLYTNGKTEQLPRPTKKKKPPLSPPVKGPPPTTLYKKTPSNLRGLLRQKASTPIYKNSDLDILLQNPNLDFSDANVCAKVGSLILHSQCSFDGHISASIKGRNETFGYANNTYDVAEPFTPEDIGSLFDSEKTNLTICKKRNTRNKSHFQLTLPKPNSWFYNNKTCYLNTHDAEKLLSHLSNAVRSEERKPSTHLQGKKLVGGNAKITAIKAGDTLYTVQGTLIFENQEKQDFCCDFQNSTLSFTERKK
ncbi:MAG: hypothetical protein JSR80_01290 [Verrucomicrobia bacterium]|nr:hypothetical protein [Verrucomicrobiota bacterium]